MAISLLVVAAVPQGCSITGETEDAALAADGRAAFSVDGSSPEASPTDVRAPEATDGSVDGYMGAKPLAQLQEEFLDLKFGMFLHFNMSTFTDVEYANPDEDPAVFAPEALDCSQWADAAVAAGMKYMVLTTKHLDGFALWNSSVTDHDVGKSRWKGGQGDVVREFVNAARTRGLGVGFYFSIADKHQTPVDPWVDVPLIKAQLKELLTNYGPVTLLWFDHWGSSVSFPRGYTVLPYEEIHTLVKALQPNVLIIHNNHEQSLVHSDIVEFERNVDRFPKPENQVPTEVADNIRSDGRWFYTAPGTCDLKSPTTLADSLASANKGASNYLLDVTPDRRGLVPDCQVSLLKTLHP